MSKVKSSSSSSVSNISGSKKSYGGMVSNAAFTAGTYVVHFVRHPVTSSNEMWAVVKETAQHYYIGSKLL